MMARRDVASTPTRPAEPALCARRRRQVQGHGIHQHILAMADQLSAGIIGQFPSKFH
jgi:hypothetical protein